MEGYNSLDLNHKQESALSGEWRAPGLRPFCGKKVPSVPRETWGVIFCDLPRDNPTWVRQLRVIKLSILNPWSDVCVFILQVKTLSFDQSGTYLAVGGSEVQYVEYVYYKNTNPAVCPFSKNITDYIKMWWEHEAQPIVSLMFLPHFDVIVTYYCTNPLQIAIYLFYMIKKRIKDQKITSENN